MKIWNIVKITCGLIVTAFVVACGDSTTYYQIENKKSGHYLASDGSTDLKQKSEPGDSGLWQLIESEEESGFYQILNKESQLYVSTMGSQIKEPMQQTDAPGDDALWEKVEFDDGYIGFRNKDSDRYLNTGGETDDNTDILQTENTATQDSVPGNGGQWILIEQ